MKRLIRKKRKRWKAKFATHGRKAVNGIGILERVSNIHIKWIEDTLIKHPDFALPGRKALLKPDKEYEVIRMDATETPIERQKKGYGISNGLSGATINKSSFIQEKREGII